MKTNKFIVIAVVVALALGGVAFYKTLNHGGIEATQATPGTNYIENYSPAVLYNGGISSQLPIQTTSDITAATLTGTTISSTGLTTVGSILIGTGGTAVSHVVAPANCTVIANANTIAASSTKDVDCAVTGLLPTDTVFANATTSISATFGGVQIQAAHASTTAGYATLTLTNNTGTTFTWTATASTSIKVFGIK